jgi:predicted  nucleic acid-binding Zn-ribbon protein
MVGKRRINGERLELTLGVFMCPECEQRFLKVLEKEKEERTLKGTIEKIRGIEKGLSVMLENLKEKMEKLKNERAELLEEIEALKKEGETRASSLEDEIVSLREEVEDLKKMLGENE